MNDSIFRLQFEMRQVFRLCFVTVLTLGGVLLASQNASQKARADEPAPAEQDVQLETLRKVWQTIDEVHWDRELIEEKWSGILPEFEEKLSKTEDVDGARNVIQGMIDRLGQSHFGIIPSGIYKRQNELGIEKGSGTLGMQIRLIDGELIVTRVSPESPAAEAGLQVGDRLDQIRSKSADEIIQKASESAEFKAGRAETYVGLIAEAMLGGSVGNKVSVHWTDGNDDSQQSDIVLGPSEGTFAEFGNLPAAEVVMKTKVLPGGVVYYHFSSFFNPVQLVTKMKTLMEEQSDSKGLILDVRGNRGGIVLLACGISNWLTTEPTAIGIMKSKTSELKLRLNPRKPHFDGKVVVLIDELSISAAEILAGGLQDATLATVIGSQSAGLVLPSIVSQLPNGDRFQYAISDFQTGEGRRLEGTGVTPDMVVPVSQESLRAEGDPVLKRALALIEGE
ncbi:MAG: S41 family peptidase [Planctomycetota bacterium]